MVEWCDLVVKSLRGLRQTPKTPSEPSSATYPTAVPSGDQAAPHSGCLGAGAVRPLTVRRFMVSSRHKAPSDPEETSQRPSGDQETPRAQPSWATVCRTCPPGLRTATAPSWQAMAHRPSGANAKPLTSAEDRDQRSGRLGRPGLP